MIPMKREKLNAGDVHRENRQLRRTIETLLEELEKSGSAVDTARVREQLPNEGIEPPWEREGFESKQEWLAERAGSQ